MKLILNEKTSLDVALDKVVGACEKLGFEQVETDCAKKAVVNFHTSLTASGGQDICSEFEKVIKGNGKSLKIVGTSSSQQGLFARLTTI